MKRDYNSCANQAHKFSMELPCAVSVEKMQEGMNYYGEIYRGFMSYQCSEYRDIGSQNQLTFLMMKTKLFEGKTVYTVIFHF